jgi:hypothetical protein
MVIVSNWFINYRTRHWKHKGKGKKGSATMPSSTNSTNSSNNTSSSSTSSTNVVTGRSSSAAVISARHGIITTVESSPETDSDSVHSATNSPYYDDQTVSTVCALWFFIHENVLVDVILIVVMLCFVQPSPVTTISTHDITSPMPHNRSLHPTPRTSTAERLLDSAFSGVSGHRRVPSSSPPLSSSSSSSIAEHNMPDAAPHHTPHPLQHLLACAATLPSLSSSSSLGVPGTPVGTPMHSMVYSSSSSSTMDHSSPLSSPDPLMLPHIRHLNTASSHLLPSATMSSGITPSSVRHYNPRSMSPDVVGTTPPTTTLSIQRPDSRQYMVTSRPSSTLPLSPNSTHIAMYGAGLGSMSLTTTPLQSPVTATAAHGSGHHLQMGGGHHSTSSTPRSPHDMVLGGVPQIGMLYGAPVTPGSMVGLRGSPMPYNTTPAGTLTRGISPLPMHSFPPSYSPLDYASRSLTPSPYTVSRGLPILPLSGPSTPTEPTGSNGAWATTPGSDDGTSTPTMSSTGTHHRGFITFPTGNTPPLSHASPLVPLHHKHDCEATNRY